MSKKRAEREVRAAHRRNKKERQGGGAPDDDFLNLDNQLGTIGLQLKEVAGDGNCLFRALGDQLDGSGHHHHAHRATVVQYMRLHRADFEPFVEDDVSFDDHMSSLAEQGTFGGNDSIVAFARMHDCSVVLHQLNKPLWQIHPGLDGSPGSWEVHISYHNGDHYNSVRRVGDPGPGKPQRIRLCAGGGSPATGRLDNRGSSDGGADSGPESDYENCPSGSRLQQLAEEVGRLAGVKVSGEVRAALELNRYSVTAAAEWLVREGSPPQPLRGGLWAPGGTGARIHGGQGGGAGAAQDRLTELQAKLQNKNISNKKRKELKKKQREEERKDRKKEEEAVEEELIINNIQSLTI